MNDRLIKHALHDIAQQEIPDDMKSLWPAIQARMERKTTRRVLRLTRFGWVTAIIVFSLMIGAGAYAFYQFGQGGDPGLSHLDEDLITSIDQSVTIDGVTVTLDWVYADEHRIALAYHAT
jgi:hypothetical protein